MAQIHLIRADTTDFDALAETLTSWNQEYRQLSCGRFHGSLRSLGVAGIELTRERWNQVIQYRGLLPRGSVGFAISLRDTGEARWLGQPVGAGTLITQFNDAEAEFIGARESDLAIVTLPRDEFSRRFRLRTGQPFDEDIGRFKYCTQRRIGNPTAYAEVSTVPSARSTFC